MTDFTGKLIANTYKDILTIATSVENSGIDSTLRRVQDGSGNNSPLKLSETSAAFTGNVSINGNLKVNGSFQPDTVNTNELQATRIVATSITTDTLNAGTLTFQDVSVSTLRAGTVSATNINGTNITVDGDRVITSAVAASVQAIFAAEIRATIANTSAALQQQIDIVSVGLSATNTQTQINATQINTLSTSITANASAIAVLEAATYASANTSATLETRIAAVSSTMATSIANVRALVTGVNASAIAVLQTSVAANASAIAVLQTSVAANASAIAINSAAITSINNVISTGAFASAGTSATLETRIAAVSSTMAASIASTSSTLESHINTVSATLSSTNVALQTSIGNSNTAIATLSATMATSISNKVSKSGDTMTGDLSFGDDIKINLGAGSDLNLYHDGSDSIIEDTGTGDLIIKASQRIWMKGINDETLIRSTENSQISLYHNNNEKFSTIDEGILVYGKVSAASLGIAGINYPTSDGTANQVIKTDGAGTLSFTSVITDGSVFASAGTSASLETRIASVSSTLATSIANSNAAIAAVSSTMATSINNSNAAITSVNTRINSVSVLTETKASAATSANLQTRINAVSVLTQTNKTSIAANASAIAVLQGITYASAGTSATLESRIAGVSSTMATSISNSNSAIATLSATMATSIANHLRLSGGTLTGSLTLNADPSTNLQAATKAYVDNLTASSIHVHEAVRVETNTTNLNATYNNGTAGVGATLTNAGTQAALVIDGVTLNTSDRVLVIGQTNQTQNGVYVVTDTGSASTNWILTRSDDADTSGDGSPDTLDEGSYFFVQEGTIGAAHSFVCNTQGTIVFGTTNITFAQFSDSVEYTAGTGINVNASRVISTSGVATTGQLTTLSATLATSIANVSATLESRIATVSALIPTSLTELGITDGTAGQYLQTNANGTYSFTSVAGGGSGISNITAGTNIALTQNGVTVTDTTTSATINVVGVASAGTSAALESRIASVSSTMATSINNSNAAITALSATMATSINNSNTNIAAVSVLTKTNKDAITSINGVLGDGSAFASAGTSATLQTKIATLSATMATSINNRTAAITSVNTRINAVSVLTKTNKDAITSINAIAYASAGTSATLQTKINAVSATMATSINNSNSAIATLSATMATSISNKVSKSGDTMTGTLNINNSTGYANIEMGGLSGAYIDFKKPFSDDHDGRMIYDGNNLKIVTNLDQPVLLQHNNSTKLSTSSIGVSVTGNLDVAKDADPSIRLNDIGNWAVDLHNYGSVGAFAIDNGGTERFRIDSSGNVGIGTTSPSSELTISSGASSATVHAYTQLEIESSSHSALQFSGSTGAEQWIWFADDSSSTPVGGITYYHGGPYMGFRVEGSERMRIDSSGNVGIGTTSPFSPLHLGTGQSSPSASGNMADNGLTISNGSGGRAIQIGVDDTAQGAYIQSGYVNNSNVANSLSFYNGANESMTITSDGNVVFQVGINAQTGTTYTTVLADQSKLVTLTNASAITVTIPANSSVAYPVGTKIDFAQLGAGQVTFAGAGGVTVNGTPTLKLRDQYSAATCIKIATDTWLLVGDLAES